MDNDSRYYKHSCPPFSSSHKRSAYEPSDAESDESPINNWKKHIFKNDKSPVRSSGTSQAIVRCSRSPYKINGQHDNGASSKSRTDLRSRSPLEVPERSRRHVSPYKVKQHEVYQEKNGDDNTARKQNQRTPPRSCTAVEKVALPQIEQGCRIDERSNHNHSRSKSVQNTRVRENEWHTTHTRGRSQTPSKAMILSKKDDTYIRDNPKMEINEMIANMKLSKAPSSDALLMQSTESIITGEIFFPHHHTALQTDSSLQNGSCENKFAPKIEAVSEMDNAHHPVSSGFKSFNKNNHTLPTSTAISHSNTSSISVASRLTSSRTSNNSSKWSDASAKTGSLKVFTANRQRNQTDAWFSCVRRGKCGRSRSPDYKAIDEAAFIEKAFVVEELRQFWADKHRPQSLGGFVCHKQQAQHLKKLIYTKKCPHILLKGPSGSGKKSLSMAVLHEIFGDSSLKVSHDIRHFQIQETKLVQFSIPVSSSPHHVEVNLSSGPENARYTLIALVKEIVSKQALLNEVSDASFKADYKVVVLHEVDKVAENVQHLIKWVMDCYIDACKIILCCKDDACILDSIKNRCEVIGVDAPVVPEIMEVLLQIAKKEKFDLPVSFAARIAAGSEKDLRKAIMALEACKSHNYPFIDEQPIPLGWEEALVELATEILADPSSKRLFIVREEFRKLLVEFVHPKLILQKLVEQFLKGTERTLRREVYFWHAYYDKRISKGTSAVLKLEEFVAKFMSIHRRSLSSVPFTQETLNT